MKGGDVLSLLVNIGIGIYFIHYYPQSVRSKLDRMPRIFTVLNRILPPLGYLLIAVSVVYALLRASAVL